MTKLPYKKEVLSLCCFYHHNNHYTYSEGSSIDVLESNRKRKFHYYEKLRVGYISCGSEKINNNKKKFVTVNKQ